jgi:bifunctional non-homologous end joining protein LigD
MTVLDTVRRQESDFDTEPAGWSEPAAQDQANPPHDYTLHVTPDDLPSIELQWATRVEQVPEGPGWVHEVELVGQRLLAYVKDGDVRLLDAWGEDWAQRLPTLARELAAPALTNCVLDGLVCALGSKEGHESELVYVAFDVPFARGRDLRNTTLIERKRILRDLLEGFAGRVRPCEYVLGAGAKVFNRACELGLEGVISKRADSMYENRADSRSWLVVKCAQRLNLVVGGFTAPHGSRRHLGALLVGSYDDDGRLIYRGKVGSGFCEDSLAELRPQLERLQQDLPAFFDPPVGSQARGVSWVAPVFGVEVEYGELTDKGKLRHARFKGLRAVAEPATRTEDMAMVRLTDPETLLFPELGLSKRDLADYLQQAAEKLLPHVSGRALSLIRWPDGGARELTADGCVLPEGVARHRTGDGADCLSVVDPLGLLGLLQMNVVEVRIHGARIDKSDHPDRLLFELCPDEGVDFGRVIEAAFELRHRLAEFGLESFVKTSGGKGLHVVAPVQRRRLYAPVARFCRIVVERMVAAAPDRYVLAANSPHARGGKVVIDHACNARQATIVAPYSVRAKPDALVSTPISWEELIGHGFSAAVRPEEFTLPNVTRRLARLDRDPWAEFFELRQWITKASFRKIGINPDLRSTQSLTVHP